MIPECSIVVPLHNQERTLSTLHLRLTATMGRLAIPYEIIYVDDASTDQTPSIVAELHGQDAAVKAIFLSRRFGAEAAWCAGLEAAAGRAVITISGDLQDPPEVIPELIDKWHEGYRIIYARPRQRSWRSPARRAACAVLQRILQRFCRMPISLDTSDFALMDRQCVDQLNNLPERTRSLRGLRRWVGFKQTQIEYDGEICLDGASRHTVKPLIRLAVDNLFAFSDLPLKAIMGLGCLVMCLAVGGLAMAAGLLGSLAPEMVALTWVGAGLALLGGVQLICLGVVSEYIARIHRDSSNRPLYLVGRRLGFEVFPRVVPDVLAFLPQEPAARQEAETARRLSHNVSDVLARSQTDL